MGIIFELGHDLAAKNDGGREWYRYIDQLGPYRAKPSVSERNANTTFPVVGLFRDQLLSL